MNIRDAAWITRPLMTNPETLLGNRPLSVQGLCEGCHDAAPEPDDVLCAECKEVESRGGNTP